MRRKSADVIFVIGMHRSGTSAFAGSAMLVGGAAPLQMVGATTHNPKGHFEPATVGQVNDKCLAEQGQSWSDCRPLRAFDPVTKARWVADFARELQTAYGPVPLKIVKDPRISRLVPLWHLAATQLGHGPGYVIMLRDPRQSASSVMRRDGMTDDAAVALWLRHMLDAEHHTRGLNRIFLATDDFSANPTDALQRVARQLGIYWPSSPDTLPQGFVEPSLMHPAQLIETALLPLALEAFRALLVLARDPQDAPAMAILDGVRATFDPQADAIHARQLAQGPQAVALVDPQADTGMVPMGALMVAEAQRAQAIARLEFVTEALTQVLRRPARLVLDHIRFHGLRRLAAVVRPVSAGTARGLLSLAHAADPERFAKGRGGLRRGSARAAQDSVLRVPFSALDEGFVPYDPPAPVDPVVKVIAFYLPQFHPFAENDAWWGKGFTEWTNVAKAVPNFVGHYQPHLPIHFGYYDLRVPSVMEEQARVAKQYGIGGFSYYFYWFGGTILMEDPLKAMLDNPAVDIPFCLTWANENWTRRWDGAEHDVLIAQNHSHADSIALLRHLARYFNDPRYIRIDGKPVFIVYRADIIPDIAGTLAAWRTEALALGFDGLYLVAAQSFQIGDPTGMGFDAAVEFPPHSMPVTNIETQLEILQPEFKGHVSTYEEAVDMRVTLPDTSYKLFRTAMLAWDNTARKQNNSHTFHGFSVVAFSQWLSALCHRVMQSGAHGPDEKLVFVNAWNEWAEGSHLEPDRKHGFGYLAAAQAAIAPFDRAVLPAPLVVPTVARAPFAVVLHLHYADLWPEICDTLAALGPHDLYVTVTKPELAALVLADRADALVEFVDNRGRDIRPFLSLLRRIRPLGYTAICKIHSKKSPHRQDGAALRKSLLAGLVDPDLAAAFVADPKLGMIVNTDAYLKRNTVNALWNGACVEALAAEIGTPLPWQHFPAGSMYWLRPEALEALDKIDLHRDWGVEKGLADGTKAHGVERIVSYLAEQAGFGIKLI